MFSLSQHDYKVPGRELVCSFYRGEWPCLTPRRKKSEERVKLRRCLPLVVLLELQLLGLTFSISGYQLLLLSRRFPWLLGEPRAAAPLLRGSQEVDILGESWVT